MSSEHCASCGARIEWAWTDKGARIPLDLGEVSDGNLRPFETYGARLIVKTVAAYQGTRRSHFATCPDADAHRRKRRR